MNKNIYDLINDMETDLSEYEPVEALDNVTAKRLKKNLHRQLASPIGHKRMLDDWQPSGEVIRIPLG